MNMFYKIENGVVVQKQPYTEEGFVEGPDDACCGYTYRKGKFYPPVTPEPTTDWLALIAARRFQSETAGITWKGYGIATDRDSRNLIDQEDRAVGRGLRTDGAGWKCLDLATGVTGFRPTSNAEIPDLAAAVYAYVAAAFKREEDLLAAVADGSITAEMLEQGWPA